MFFPIREYPTPALEKALAEVGVVCRPLPEVDLPHSNATDTETDLSGFTMKVAALLLSRFQEVSNVMETFDLAGLNNRFAALSYNASVYRASWHAQSIAVKIMPTSARVALDVLRPPSHM